MVTAFFWLDKQPGEKGTNCTKQWKTVSISLCVSHHLFSICSAQSYKAQMALRFGFANRNGDPCWSKICLSERSVFAAVKGFLLPTCGRCKWQTLAHRFRQQEMFQPLAQEQSSGFLLVTWVLLTVLFYRDFNSSGLKKWHSSTF